MCSWKRDCNNDGIVEKKFRLVGTGNTITASICNRCITEMANQ